MLYCFVEIQLAVNKYHTVRFLRQHTQDYCTNFLKNMLNINIPHHFCGILQNIEIGIAICTLNNINSFHLDEGCIE